MRLCLDQIFNHGQQSASQFGNGCVADALNAAREAASKAGRTLTVFVGTTNDMPVETWGNFLSARVNSVVLDLDYASSSSKKVQA